MITGKFELQRELHFLLNGAETPGKARIGGIEHETETGLWVCHWSIDHVAPEGGRFRGRDPPDAFVRCYRFVGELLRGSEEDGLVVWWQERGDHGGF